MGIASFTLAVLARGFSGLITIYLLYPWKISFGFSKEKAKSLLSFGLPFQANSILALIKDDLFTVFLGKVLPFSEVGYIGWAKKWAEFPLRLVMDNVIKVTFPAYARLQGRPEYLSRAIEKSLFFISLLVFPISVGLVFLIKPLVFLIPRYSKWEPALFSFYIFVLVTVMATFSSPLTNAFNAIGKISISLKFMIMWTILLWCLSPFLITRLGFNGIPISFLIIGLTSFLVVFIAKKYFHFTVLNNINPSFISSLVMGTFLFLGQEKFTSNFISLFIYIFLGFTIYAATLLIFFKRKIFVEIRSLTK